MTDKETPIPVAPRLVSCPGCGGDSVYALSNPFRPFCSDRCKNMDLGAWASESFRVGVNSNAEDQADAEPAPSSASH